MMRYAAIGALVIALGGVAWGSFKHSQVAGLKTALADEKVKVRTLTAARDIAKVSATLEAQRAAREAQRADDAKAAIEAMLTGDFDNADAPVDPRLADFLDCLRNAGTGQADCARHFGGNEDAMPDQ